MSDRMKIIHNKETKVADLIEDTSTPPEGWTDKAPNWVMYEAWDYTNDCWGESEELKTKAENQVKIAEARKYLFDTDYKIIKQTEGVEDCPVDVLDKRKECRDLINELSI